MAQSSTFDDDVVISGDLINPSNKSVRQRIKEKWNSIKASLKTTRGKVVLSLATIGACIIIAVTGTGIGAAVAAKDVNSALDSANYVISAGMQTKEFIDQSKNELDSHIEFVTPEEQQDISNITANVEAWMQKSQEVGSLVEEVKGDKNVFSAKSTAQDELLPAVDQLNSIDLNKDSAQIATLLNTVKGRVQGVEDAEVSANQQIIQSMINGVGSYYNMKEIQNIMDQINSYFADADGDGIADIQQTVNSIKNPQLQSLASKVAESMFNEKSLAESTFGLLQTNWNEVIQYLNSNDQANAISHYQTNIESSATDLEKNLFSIKAGYDNITNYYQQDEQQAQQTIIEGAFSESEISTYLTYFKGAGIKGTIDEVNYDYNKLTGEAKISVNSTVNSQDRVTVLKFTTSAGYDSIDAGSIIDAFNKASAVSKSVYTISNQAQHGSLTVSNNGTSQTVTGNFNTGYALTMTYNNDKTTITVDVIMQNDDGQIFSLGRVTKTVLGNDKEYLNNTIEEMISQKIQASGFQNNIEGTIESS